MNLEYLGFLLLLSAAFFLIGYLTREAKSSCYSFLSASVLLIVSGLLLAFSPLALSTGSSIVTSGSVITVTQSYTPIPTFENVFLIGVLVLGGLWGVGASVYSLVNWLQTEEE